MGHWYLDGMQRKSGGTKQDISLPTILNPGVVSERLNTEEPKHWCELPYSHSTITGWCNHGEFPFICVNGSLGHCNDSTGIVVPFGSVFVNG